ncbi:TonB-dependent receptor [Erythrobacter sp. YT30]|uniref:TonB-dependent receptor n=1 Tax=Erythrobacter sp. YT30 TaxID=1735012 RepID=UPI00076D718B|nr:TonB-dependent receptor [Erythrobacter sp. YT30]KWV92148.1 TonB-dependent receptor [Erythrobacter sp. YT30]
MLLSRLLATSGAIALAAGLATPAFAGEVRGTVSDASDVDALQAVEVRIVELGRRTTTERDGTFVFNDVPEGSYTIVASYIGADPVQYTVAVPAQGTVTRDFALGQTGSQILVIGQSAAQASALSRKRAADGVSDVLTRDAIGQFPDQNVAESLRRLPGINVLNDQGEGRFVAVRGLDPNLNATSVNGVRIPSPEGDIRAVALDVVSSEIIESIEVKKSLTPDMDADTIGASIEIQTTSAFDRKKDLFVAKIGGSYNELRDTFTADLSADFSTRLTDNFGVTGGISYYDREFQTDNIEADDWQLEDGQIYAEEVQYRDYLVDRERISATLGFDARVGESTELYLKGVWSQFDDQEFRRRLIFGLGDANVGGTSANPTFDDTDAVIEAERDVKDRFERQRIRTLVFGGESDWGDLNAEYSVSWAKSSELEEGSVDPTVFAAEFEDSGLGVAFDFSELRRPVFSVTGNNAFFDPSVYELDEVELTVLSDAEDEEFAGQFDLGYDIVTDSGVFTIQGGAKARFREKTFEGTIEFYERDDYTLADVLGEGPSNTLANLAPLPGLGEATEFFNSNFSTFELVQPDSAIDSANQDYAVEEDILAGYLLGRWETDNLLVIGGVRYERTDNTLNGFTTAVDADENVTVTPLNFERDYDHWLPSINVRYAAQDNLIMRLAGYRSLVRPNFEQLAPRVEIDEDNEAVIGNPTLDPTTAWNIDASIEYYMANNGAITAAFFYKDLDDYITELVLDSPGTLFGVDFEEAETFINGESAEIYGFEFGFYQKLDFLPGFLDGTLVQFNYTYTDASGLIADGDIGDINATPTFREIALPATSENTFNAVLGYEKAGLNLRLAGTYRDGFLDEINGDGPDFDRFTDSLFQLDFTARYQATDNVQVYFEWININNAEFFAFNNLGGRQNILQYEEYNWTMKGGVRLTF